MNLHKYWHVIYIQQHVNGVSLIVDMDVYGIWSFNVFFFVYLIVETLHAEN